MPEMSHYVLRREQRIPRPIDEVFAFFAEARNLEALTPAWLGFRIVSVNPLPIQAGTLIRYQLRWHGIPLRWLTEIQSWTPPTGFVDVQLKGPYRLWYHTHSFEPLNGGTLMRDEVRYALPFGPLGRLVHVLMVRANVEAIFDFRAARVSEIFGQEFPNT